jgi:hypothetical protein
MTELSYSEFKEQMEKHLCKVCLNKITVHSGGSHEKCLKEYFTYKEEMVRAHGKEKIKYISEAKAVTKAPWNCGAI